MGTGLEGEFTIRLVLAITTPGGLIDNQARFMNTSDVQDHLVECPYWFPQARFTILWFFLNQKADELINEQCLQTLVHYYVHMIIQLLRRWRHLYLSYP